ncbi:MAG: hypothetical protein GXO34_04265 [Deltaproteobacteria bacterium]|nr:hypothetical protein [Deltaproteobacteria bacterium]
MKLNKKQKGFWEKFIRPGESGRRGDRWRGDLDLTRPVVLLGLTLAYAFIVFFLVIGVPWMGMRPGPIPPEDLPVAITFFVLAYIVVIGGFYLRDRRRKK